MEGRGRLMQGWESESVEIGWGGGPLLVGNKTLNCLISYFISCCLEDIDPIFKMANSCFREAIDLVINIFKTYKTDLQQFSAHVFPTCSNFKISEFPKIKISKNDSGVSCIV